MTDHPNGIHQAPTVLLARGRPWRTGATRTSVAPESLALELAQAGPAALAKVSGGFAVAGRDAQGRSWVAVDPFGIEPACWRVVNGQLHVASRADELADIEPRADIRCDAIYEYLYFHVIPSPATAFEGVFRVPPGHAVCHDGREWQTVRYWQPRFDTQAGGGFEAQAAEFRETLRESVAQQLDGSKPACYLSGGTDSSTVAGMISRLTDGNASSYSIGFDAAGYDEMAFARIASKHFGTQHHEYYVTPADLVTGIPLVAASFDQPFGNSSAVPAYYCARMAQADGVSRLLAGDGGDELFGGNARYAKQKLFDLYQWVPGPVRRGLMEPLLGRAQAAPLGVLRKAASYVEQAKVPMPDRLEIYNLLLRLDPRQVLDPGLLTRVDTAAPLRHQRAVWQQAGAASELSHHLAFDWRYTLAEADLPKVRVSARLAGVEPGFPMLDSALVDFSLRLSDADKLRGQQLRWFFKQALRGFLPQEIIEKKKQGFGLPFGVWLLQNPALLALARDSVDGLVSRGVVLGSAAQRLFETQVREHPGYYGEMVWILMMLEQWLRQRRPDWKVPAPQR
ncbi:MAG: asparagine synthase C-terminal domain-containing protein [Hydrogenophaga sp.]|nr:asparagine synthase C-terminal domain-containing protein [Hydrogenophaga sp.]